MNDETRKYLRGGGTRPERPAVQPLPEPEADDAAAALERLGRLMRATRPGGEIIVAGSSDRARDAGLCLRAGLTGLRQHAEGGAVFTSGRVPGAAISPTH